MKNYEFTISEPLEQDIRFFFQEAVDKYLEELLQQVYKREISLQERDGSFVIDKFIKKVKEADIATQHISESLEKIADWKIEFTKKILTPKYLSNHSFVDLRAVMDSIKNAILTAAIDKKVSFYKSMCQGKLFKNLQKISPKERHLPAKLIIANTIKNIEKSGDASLKDKFLASFQSNELKDFLAKIPYRPIYLYTPKELENKLKEIIKEKIESNNITSKLKVINTFLIDLKKTASSLLTELNLEKSAKESIEQILLKIKAEVLAEACFEEIKSSRKEVPASEFMHVKENIIRKYTSIYIHDSDSSSKQVKDYFFKSLNDLESLMKSMEKETISEKLPPQKPKRTSFWKRI
jgi:hypothetical protein